jgi:hypothetical protein
MSISFEDKYRRKEIRSSGVFDVCANDLGEPTEKVSVGCGELVTPDEPPVVAKPLLDPIVVEDR